MSRRAVAAITLMVAGMVTSAGLAQAGVIGGQPADCPASQPVYSGTALVGSWHVTLHPGQSVPLPDGDTASCTAAGLYIH